MADAVEVHEFRNGSPWVITVDRTETAVTLRLSCTYRIDDRTAGTLNATGSMTPMQARRLVDLLLTVARNVERDSRAPTGDEPCGR